MGIFLIALGAIIRYAINFEVSGVEEGTIGLILIIAGIAVAIVGLVAAPFRVWAARRSGHDPVDPVDRRY